MWQKALIGGGSGTTLALLWTNPNPTSTYALNKTETIDFSNYNTIIIEYQINIQDTVTFGKVYGITKTSQIGTNVGGFYYSSSYFVAGRTITSFTSNSITFGTPVYGNIASGLVKDRLYTGVPLKIYGINLDI